MWVDVNVHLELMLAPSVSVNQAAAAMAVKFIATGTYPDQWDWLVDRTPYLAFGLHPRYAVQTSDWMLLLERHLRENPRSAVGEIGLDFEHFSFYFLGFQIPRFPCYQISRLGLGRGPGLGCGPGRA